MQSYFVPPSPPSLPSPPTSQEVMPLASGKMCVLDFRISLVSLALISASKCFCSQSCHLHTPPGSPPGFSCYSNVAISGIPLSMEGVSLPSVTSVEECAQLCLNSKGCSLFIQSSLPFTGCSLMSEAFRGAASTRYDPSVLAACLRQDSDGTMFRAMNVWR